MFGVLESEVVLVTVAFLHGSPAAYARPTEEEENGFAAPEGSKKAEQQPTHETQAAGLWGIRAVVPPILQEIVPEL